MENTVVESEAKSSCSVEDDSVNNLDTETAEQEDHRERLPLLQKITAIKDFIERIIFQVLFRSIMFEILSDLVAVLSIIAKTIFWVILRTFYAIISVPAKSACNYFENERVLIIGGCSEIGKEIALQLAGLNINTITLWDTNAEQLEEIANEIKELQSSSKIFTYTLPCLSKESVQDTITKMKLEAGHVSVLVNAIDIDTNTNDKILTAETSSLLNVLQQELMMYTLAVKAFLPTMLELRHGCITIVVPPQIVCNKAKQSLYCTSKAALYSYANVLKTELAEGGYAGVKVACICPWRNVAPSKVVAQIVVETITNKNSFVVVPSLMSLVHPMIGMLPGSLQSALMDAFTTKANC